MGSLRFCAWQSRGRLESALVPELEQSPETRLAYGMSFGIRRAGLESERAELIELLQRCLTPKFDARRFEWLYCRNPHGKAHAWVAYEKKSNTIVGAAAAFPRKVYVDGKEELACVLGDFCMDKRYRSLGPALQLQRTCLEASSGAPFVFCYDFPSASMMAIYKRLGMEQRGNLLRFARPLRADRRIRQVVKSRWLARGLAAPLNLVLGRGQRRARLACESILHAGPCGEEFTALDRALRARTGTATVRTAEYLNWRYLGHPSVKYEILKAQRGQELVGYAVFAHQGDDASIADLSTIGQSDTVVPLLLGVTDLLRRRGVVTISMSADEQHPWRAEFESAGFRPREAAPIVTCARAGYPIPGGKWYLMQGERDI